MTDLRTEPARGASACDAERRAVQVVRDHQATKGFAGKGPGGVRFEIATESLDPRLTVERRKGFPVAVDGQHALAPGRQQPRMAPPAAGEVEHPSRHPDVIEADQVLRDPG